MEKTTSYSRRRLSLLLALTAFVISCWAQTTVPDPSADGRRGALMPYVRYEAENATLGGLARLVEPVEFTPVGADFTRPTEATGYIVYVEDNSGWDDLYLYAWNDNGEPRLGQYPGLKGKDITVGGKHYKYFDTGADRMNKAYWMQLNNGVADGSDPTHRESGTIAKFSLNMDRWLKFAGLSSVEFISDPTKQGAGYNPNDVVQQASNWKYVSLPNGTGDETSSLEWTIHVDENGFGGGDGITLRYTIPDDYSGFGQNGSLDVYVNDNYIQSVIPTSTHNWQYFDPGNPSYPKDKYEDGYYRAFAFDEIHFILSSALKEGDKIKIVNNGTTGIDYGIDFIEIENVPERLTKPERSVTMNTSWETITNISCITQAHLNAAIEEAKSKGFNIIMFPDTRYSRNPDIAIKEKLYIPESAAGMIFCGYGEWYTNIVFISSEKGGGGFTGNVSNVEFRDMHISSELKSRYDEEANYKCFQGAFLNCTFQNLWIEHFECGFWLGDYSNTPPVYSNNTQIINCRIRNNLADGINLCQGTSNSLIYNCSIRNNGDDGLAMWNSNDNQAPDENKNTFAYNTIDLIWRAGGIGIYGGNGHQIYNNYIRDTYQAAGIHLNTTFSGHKFVNNTDGITFQNNTLVNCGTERDIFGNALGAIDLNGNNSSGYVNNVTFSGTEIYKSQNENVKNASGNNNVTIDITSETAGSVRPYPAPGNLSVVTPIDPLEGASGYDLRPEWVQIVMNFNSYYGYTYLSKTGLQNIHEGADLGFYVKVKNYGTGVVPANVTLEAKIIIDEGTDHEQSVMCTTKTNSAIQYTGYTWYTELTFYGNTAIFATAGTHTVKIVLDPNNLLYNEANKSNNTLTYKSILGQGETTPAYSTFTVTSVEPYDGLITVTPTSTSDLQDKIRDFLYEKGIKATDEAGNTINERVSDVRPYVKKLKIIGPVGSNGLLLRQMAGSGFNGDPYPVSRMEYLDLSEAYLCQSGYHFRSKPEYLTEIQDLGTTANCYYYGKTSSISWYQFCHCTTLKEIILPNGTTNRPNCFQKWTYETESDFNKRCPPTNALTEIDYCAFLGSGIEKLVIPATVQTVNEYAFRAMPNLKEVVFEEGSTLTNPYGAFLDCPELESVTLPSSLWEIRDQLFNNCPKLKYIKLAGSTKEYEAGVYDFTEFPNLKNVGWSAFRNNDQLTKIVLPSTVETVDANVFDNCQNLKEINIGSTNCAYNENWLYNLPKDNNGNLRPELTFANDATALTAITNAGESFDPLLHLNMSEEVPSYDIKKQQFATVSLKRGLRDGTWGTVIMPFAIKGEGDTEEERQQNGLQKIEQAFGTGAVIAELKWAKQQKDGSILFRFKQVTETRAHEPYIILAKDFPGDKTYNISMVDVEAVTAETDTTFTNSDVLGYTFYGNYNKISEGKIPMGAYFIQEGQFFTVTDPHNTLYANPYRGYLYKAGDPGSKILKMSVVEQGVETAIEAADFADEEHFNGASVYDLQGVKVATANGSLSKLGLKKGIYMVNGKKYVIQ